MKRAILIFLLSVFYLIPTFSQVKLEQLFELAEKNSAILKNGLLEISKQKLKEKKAQASLLPNMDMGINQNLIYGLSFDQISGTLSQGNNWSRYLSANLTASISSRDILDASIKQDRARLSMDISKNILTSDRVKLRNSITIVFFEILKNYELHDALSKRLLKVGEIHTKDSILFNLGKRSKEDILTGKLKLYEINGLLDSICINRAGLIAKLESICGSKIDQPFVNAEKSEMEKNLNALLFLTDEWKLHESPSIIENQIKHSILQKELKIDKFSFYPELIFSTSYGSSFSSLNLTSNLSGTKPFSAQILDNKFFQFYISLRYPISNLYKDRGKVKEKEIELLQINNTIQNLKTQIEQEEKEFRMNLLKRRDWIYVLENQLDLFREMLNIKEKKYEIGLIDREELEKTVSELEEIELKIKKEKLDLYCGSTLYKNTFYYGS